MREVHESLADRVGRSSARTAAEFKSNVLAALRRLQKLPQLIRAFFADPDLADITA